MAAFERLKAPEPKSTIVATGTGSGKTECFLYPILDYILHCNEEHDEKKRKGIKAIIIYPMNALASDQAKRLTKLCFEINRNAKASGLKGMLPTVGLYTGAPGVESRRMSDDGGNYVCITDRKVLRQNPPDILLTNSKMRDYLRRATRTGASGRPRPRTRCAISWSTSCIRSTVLRARTSPVSSGV